MRGSNAGKGGVLTIQFINHHYQRRTIYQEKGWMDGWMGQAEMVGGLRLYQQRPLTEEKGEHAADHVPTWPLMPNPFVVCRQIVSFQDNK